MNYKLPAEVCATMTVEERRLVGLAMLEMGEQALYYARRQDEVYPSLGLRSGVWWLWSIARGVDVTTPDYRIYTAMPLLEYLKGGTPSMQRLGFCVFEILNEGGPVKKAGKLTQAEINIIKAIPFYGPVNTSDIITADEDYEDSH